MQIKGKSIAGILILIILAVLCLYFFKTLFPSEPPIQINENIGFNKSTEVLLNKSIG